MDTNGNSPAINRVRGRAPQRENTQDNTKIFRVHKKYTDNFPIFQAPKITGYWSVDGVRKQHHDSSQLRYYYAREGTDLNFDLNQGQHELIMRPENLDDEKINHLLRWIEINHRRILAHPDSPRWLQPYFISFRGTLSKIMESPYNVKAGWTICAAKWRGSIYLCEYKAAYDTEMKWTENSRNKMLSYWGVKFRQYMGSETPTKIPDVSKPVNESEKFYCVFQTRLGYHHLLYRGEMDAVCSDRKFKDPLPLRRLEFVKIRTGKLSENPWQELVRKRLLSLRLWGQMHLTGVQHVVRGMREDTDGILRQIKNSSTSELIETSKTFWQPEICMKFCDEFLKFVHRTVRNNCNTTIYKFVREPLGSIVVTELPPTSEFAFIPDWYKNLPGE